MRRPALALLALAACSRDPLTAGGDASVDASIPGDLLSIGSCGRTSESITITYIAPDGSIVSCGKPMMGQTQRVTLTAAIFSANGPTLWLDSCAPNADCNSILHTLEIKSPSLPQLESVMPRGGFVHLDLEIAAPWGCATRLSITSVDQWGGVMNPAGPANLVHLLATDGAVEPNGPFAPTVEAIPLNCAADAGMGCGGSPPDDYALRFVEAQSPPIVVAMGQTLDWTPDLVPSQRWRLHNARSYQTPYCDDYWNWSWWLIRPL
jgi:hypothetical protein